MRRHINLITALLSIIFCFSILTLTAYAVDLDGDGIDDEIIVTEPPYEEPTYEPAPVETEPPYEEPTYEPAPVETEPPYYEPETEPKDDYGGGFSYDSDNGGESDASYVGGGQSYVVPENTAPSATLFNSNHKIDDKTLSGSDWKDISARLKNASNSGDDSDDFGFIKNNDSLGDNGQWMLISGILCLILSGAGIIYVIVSSVKNKKALSGAGSHRRYESEVSGGRYLSDSDYGDDYKVSKSEQKKSDRRSKFNTAEVRLPKSSSGAHRKGGKHYR